MFNNNLPQLNAATGYLYYNVQGKKSLGHIRGGCYIDHQEAGIM